MRLLYLVSVCVMVSSCVTRDYTPSSIIGTHRSVDTLVSPGWLDSAYCEETSIVIDFQNFDDLMKVNSSFEDIESLRHAVDSVKISGKKVLASWDASRTSFDCVWTFSNREFYYKDSHGILLDRLLWADAAKTGLQHEMVEAMIFWVEEVGVDGYRCVNASKVPVEFYEALRRRLDDLGSGAVLLADSLREEYYTRAFDKVVSYD